MVKVNTEKCIGCGLCTKDCIVKDIELVDGKANIKNVACMKCGHCIAVCPKEAIATDEYNMADVKEYEKENFEVDADNLLNFIKFRRSVRQFKTQDVENEKLMKIIEAGRFTQTGGNAQNVSYIVVKDKLDSLKEMTFETLNAMGKQFVANPNTDKAILKYAYMWLDMYKNYKENPAEKDGIFFNAPAIILTISDSPVNASLASSNMELMTNALGLGTFFSGFFTRAAEVNKDIAAFLGLKETDKIVTCMVIGYPNIKYIRTAPRKEANVAWL